MNESATLPTFLISGAQKAGTTALYEALRAHPDVCMSRPKETEFFNWRYRRGWEWFESHFEHYDGEAAVGEASTRTMASPEAPARIADRLPDVKLIFVLRDPVERAHSAFWYYLTQGILRPGEDFGSFIRNEGHPLRQEIIHYGFYDTQLERFLNCFDRSQLLLIRYLDLGSRPRNQVRRVCKFVGVDPSEGASPPKSQNATPYPASQSLYALAHRLWKPFDHLVSESMPGITDTVRKYGRKLLLSGRRPQMKSEDRQYLEQLYTPTANALETRFELDLAHWKENAR